MEGLPDRQAADAVRRCMDWKYVLSLDLHDPGFDFTLLHDFRQRLLANDAAQRLLDTLLAACKASGLIKARGTQRTDSTHVLAAIRTLQRLECILDTMHLTLNQLPQHTSTWVRQHVPPAWYDRYGLRADRSRLPKEASKREALAAEIGADGAQLVRWVYAEHAPPSLRHVPALAILRHIWMQQFAWSVTEQGPQLRWRTLAEEPPTSQLIQSPFDIDARYGSKRDTHWVGYKVHVSETCDDGRPDLLTQVITTPATMQDSDMGPVIHQALVDRDLAPGTHVLDSGYIDSHLLTTAQTQHNIDVVGPPFGSYSRQHKAGQGYDLQAFAIDWEAKQARCPQGHTSVKWTPGHDGRGGPTIRIRFDLATCRACPVRPLCTWAKAGARQLSVRPQEQHVALQAARQRQHTLAFRQQYAIRAGVESTISQGTRRFDLRRSRYIGLARTHLQHILVAVAMNLVRVMAWLWNDTVGDGKRPLGHFARCAPHPLARKALIG